MKQTVIAVVGGGAAGFFAAINCASNFPHAKVIIFEKSNKLLSKVRISGGGRCNVTNAYFDNSDLSLFYPRGNKELRGPFSRFGAHDTVNWFESRGVKLKSEEDGRMFPVTDKSETIINCLMNEANKNSVSVKTNYNVESVQKINADSFQLFFQNGEKFICNKMIITTGGSPANKNYEWIKNSGHTIIFPVPSLFTFNVSSNPLKGLEGISVFPARIKLDGTKFAETGSLLITHWGISGPPVIKLSAFAARWLNERKYEATVLISWLPNLNREELKNEIYNLKEKHPTSKIYSNSFFGLPQRLWQRICSLSGINEKENCSDLSKEKINGLVENCINMILVLKGKTTFKEEFVTCGGVSLKEINFQTMESTKVPGLYFAGEVLDIDGVTGGYNFQSAWTTGWLAGLNVVK